MDPSNGKVPKLGETSTQNVKEHESPEKITNSILQVEFVMGENFQDENILETFSSSGNYKEAKELKNLITENENKIFKH